MKRVSETQRAARHLAKLSNHNVTDKQREARRLNMEKARVALAEKRRMKSEVPLSA